MNHLDIFIIAMVAYGAYKGFKNGLLKEVATLIGLVLGIFLAIIASDVAGLVVKGLVDWNPLPFQIIVFVLVFVIVSFLFKLLATLMEKVLRILLMNFINKIGGLILGGLKFALITGVALLLLSATGINVVPEKISTESLTYRPVTGLVDLVLPRMGFLGFENNN